MYFQKNASMDRELMTLSTKKSNDHIKEQQVDNETFFINGKNFDAHVHSSTKDIHVKYGPVMALFPPPTCTEVVQSTNVDHEQSIRYSIGFQLDTLLMKDDHLHFKLKNLIYFPS